MLLEFAPASYGLGVTHRSGGVSFGLAPLGLASVLVSDVGLFVTATHKSAETRPGSWSFPSLMPTH